MTEQKLTIEKEIPIGADPRKIFLALTDPKEIVKHFPYTSVVSDNKVGGKINFFGEVNGKGFTDYGRIEILDEGHCFQYSYWSDNHGTERLPENYLTILYMLKRQRGGTVLSLKHSNIPAGDYHSNMTVAWDHLLLKLKHGLELKD